MWSMFRQNWHKIKQLATCQSKYVKRPVPFTLTRTLTHPRKFSDFIQTHCLHNINFHLQPDEMRTEPFVFLAI